jgi:hypothetical protein
LRHTRHYTLEQANAARAWVAGRLERIRGVRATLAELGQRAVDAIDGLDPQLGGAYPGREVAASLVDLSRTITELEAVEVVLRDVDRGLVDFPALRDGQEVYLCWLVDEDEVRHWHPLDSGFAGRQPV